MKTKPQTAAQAGVQLLNTLTQSIAETAEAARFQLARYHAGKIPREKFDERVYSLHKETHKLLAEINQLIFQLIELPPEDVGIELHRRLKIYANELKRRVN